MGGVDWICVAKDAEKWATQLHFPKAVIFDLTGFTKLCVDTY
jgi:hypothetical protein